MLETEMVTRISIPKLLLSRIFIIGVGDLLLLTASLFLVSKKAELGAVSVALYLLLPYLIACCGYMFIGAHTHCEQQGFASTAFSFSLIALLLVLHKTAPAVYEQASAPIWIVLCAICAVILIIGIYRLLNRAASLDLSPSGI